MQQTVCSLQYAVCSMQCVVCSVQYAVCNVHLVMHNVQVAVCSVQFTQLQRAVQALNYLECSVKFEVVKVTSYRLGRKSLLW